NNSNSFSVLGHPARKLPQALRFELSVVHEDAAAVSQSLAERTNERSPGITVIRCQELEMLRCCSGLLLHMNRPLKREVIVRMHANKPWNRWIDGFKIHEAERVFKRFKFALQFWAKPRLPCLH